MKNFLRKKTAASIMVVLIFSQSQIVAQTPLDNIPIEKNQVLNINQQARWASSSTSTSTSTRYGEEKVGFRVHVYGFTAICGIFVVEPSDRLTTVLARAGGITSNGSERRVELRRGKNNIGKYDLLKLRQTGDLTQNPFIQEGDVIYVPEKEVVVRIEGPVKIPGDYEILVGETLKDVIYELSRGFTTGLAPNRPIEIIRYSETSKLSKVTVENIPKALATEHLFNGDIIYVPHKFNEDKSFNYGTSTLPNDNIAFPTSLNSVFVLGGVKFPKQIPYEPHHTIGNYIALAGGQSRLATNKIEVLNLSNENTVKTMKNSHYQVNPGDTIIVEERLLGPEFWITFMLSIVSLGVTSYAIFK